jgi:hypothetical protein
VIDIDDIRSRYQLLEDLLGESGRRLFAANEALAQGYGGVSATAQATGLARSTITHGIAELRAGGNAIGTATRQARGVVARRLWCISRVYRPRLRR